MLPKMQASHFVKKTACSSSTRAAGSGALLFHDNKPHECLQTLQVVRSEFDQMMLDNAREHGLMRTRASTCSGPVRGRARRRRPHRDAAGVRRDVHARVVVDASGQAALPVEPVQAAPSGIPF